jgi:LysM repeat protein
MIKLLIIGGLSWFSPIPKDSIGTETINGKVFVIHKVDEKETLFAISRRYRASVDDILKYNEGASDGLDIGEILKVPYTAKAVNRTGEGLVHQVQAKETMFSISKKYGVTIDEIKQWNNLRDNSLSVGQDLVIKKKASSGSALTATKPNNPVSVKGAHTVAAQETMYSISRQYGVTVQQLKEWNNLDDSGLQIGQSLVVVAPEQSSPVVKKTDSVKTTAPVQPVVTSTPTPVETKKDPQPVKTETKTQTTTPPSTIRISESIKNGSESVESGIAELIEGTEGNRKYLALHRTAPIGTILKIRNEMNNREVFVRVMGKLPDTALTDKLIIRISKSAYDRLGAIDQRFRVEVTYYK